jgi:hypothetical protein
MLPSKSKVPSNANKEQREARMEPFQYIWKNIDMVEISRQAADSRGVPHHTENP